MCRACQTELNNTEYYLKYPVETAKEVNYLMRKLEQELLNTGGMTRIHKSLVKLRKEYNRVWCETPVDDINKRK